RRPRVADGRLARAGGVRPDGHHLLRAPEPEAAPARRRLGGPPAAQGLPDRRRAGSLLGGGVVATAPEPTRAPIYEGTRTPEPTPTVLRVPQALRCTGS